MSLVLSIRAVSLGKWKSSPQGPVRHRRQKGCSISVFPLAKYRYKKEGKTGRSRIRFTDQGEIKLKLGLRRWGVRCVHTPRLQRQHHTYARRTHKAQCSNLKPATADQTPVPKHLTFKHFRGSSACITVVAPPRGQHIVCLIPLPRAPSRAQASERRHSCAAHSARKSYCGMALRTASAHMIRLQCIMGPFVVREVRCGSAHCGPPTRANDTPHKPYINSRSLHAIENRMWDSREFDLLARA
ncbi:hypothetical protein P171DRAFT_59536 [Karstenula rhodostoma CBS 690.94]|uniref:Uncharacterized protein n=1 Tax=Karstenula rhodostoma CBS 690.94 TaxID=1392251 RepID=A0A9P4PFI7_9PLEO|nr:hypothetical protein P171DRAFT_59536 [Karstenula rhodostoma CBS 690.94]